MTLYDIDITNCEWNISQESNLTQFADNRNRKFAWKEHLKEKYLDLLQIKLERVLGVTVSSNAALACDTTSDLVAYPAG